MNNWKIVKQAIEGMQDYHIRHEAWEEGRYIWFENCPVKAGWVDQNDKAYFPQFDNGGGKWERVVKKMKTKKITIYRAMKMHKSTGCPFFEDTTYTVKEDCLNNHDGCYEMEVEVKID